MADRLRFLLDTNILIPLQDSMLALQPSLTEFVRLCNAYGHQLLYHPASVEDIQRDPDVARRTRTLARLRQYQLLQEGDPCPWNTPQTSTNDACDNRLLWALQQNAAHAFVTEDKDIHRKARQEGLGGRVYVIQQAHDWLRRLHEPGSVVLPYIDEVELHTLTPQLTTPFFDSLREGYDDFNGWFERVAQQGRRAWVYRAPGNGQVLAICVFDVQIDEPIDDDGQTLPGPALKLCTFKVGEAVRGRKIGELFLRAAFQHATNHRCEHIFLHANGEQQDRLTDLLVDFGFYRAGDYKGDAVMVKDHPINPPAIQMDPFEYVRRFYPHYDGGENVRKFIVPIQPRYHDILFPDSTVPGRVLPDGHPRQHVGNAIKLAYLSNAPSNRPRAGDVVLFYRSHDRQAITTLGIVERYEVQTSADEIAQLVSRRTVYSMEDIVEMTERPTHVKVMLFRMIKNFDRPVTQDRLRQMRVIHGWPQSITEIRDESFSRILTAANG